MRGVIKIILLLTGLCLTSCYPCYAAQNVLVLPGSTGDDNFYAFPEVSEVIVNDVTEYFNKTAKIHSPNLYEVNKKINKDRNLKNLTDGVAYQYKTSKNIDYAAYRKISKEFGTNYVLLISSLVTEKNLKRNIWEVLRLGTDFNTIYSFVLETNATLLDVHNDMVMWSKTYRKKLSDKQDGFSAKDNAAAYAVLENIRLYSRDILSQDIAQNIILRFFPKSIRPVDLGGSNTEGSGILRYDRLLPQSVPKSNIDYGNYGEIIFSL